MGLSPREVDDLSLWEFTAIAEAWERANTPDSQQPLTRDEYADAAALLKRIEGVG